MEKPTLTINEVLALKRLHGIPASFATERAGIKSGAFPYGQCIEAGKRAVFNISRAKLMAWIKDFTGEATASERGVPHAQ